MLWGKTGGQPEVATKQNQKPHIAEEPTKLLSFNQKSGSLSASEKNTSTKKSANFHINWWAPLVHKTILCKPESLYLKNHALIAFFNFCLSGTCFFPLAKSDPLLWFSNWRILILFCSHFKLGYTHLLFIFK